MARIIKRSNKYGVSYQATVRRKGFDTVSRTFDTKGEALVWAASIEQEMKDRRYNSPRLAMSISLESAINRYLSNISSSKAHNTELRDQACAKRLLERLGKDTPLGEIDGRVAAQYRDERLQEVSAYSVRLELSLLSHMFKKAKKEWGIPVENPIDKIERPAPPRGRTRFLTNKEAISLLESCKKSRNTKLYYFILTLLHTGMRSSEAAGLKWNQVDFNKRLIFLSDSKNGDQRMVPMTNLLVSELSSLKSLCNKDENNLVFLLNSHFVGDTLNGRPGQKFRDAFEHARKRAGLHDVKMHDLRHTAASQLIMAGADLRTIAEILGHKTMQMVHRYTHLLNDHKLKAVDLIGSFGVDEDVNQINR